MVAKPIPNPDAIEPTPAMIEADAEVIRTWDDRFENAGDIAVKVWGAMFSAIRTPPARRES